MNRFIALSFLVLCATEGLQAARAAEPIQIFLDQESANPVSKKLRKGKYATVRTIKLEFDTLDDFDINTFTDENIIRRVWGRDLGAQADALITRFHTNFLSYATHHRNSYTGTVKMYEETRQRPNPKTKHRTTFEVWNEDTLAAARRLLEDKPLVLNMADDITPGGFLNSGGRAQEESISYRAHDMVIALMRCKQAVFGNAWHNVYQKTEDGLKFIAQTGAIYVPQAKVLRTENAERTDYDRLPEEDQFSVDILASVAYDLRWSRGRAIPADYEDVTKEKIRTQLRVAIDNKHKTLLLSAFGCGCHYNNPRVVSNYYREIFNDPEFKGAFKKVVFSILGDPNFNVFRQTFAR